MNLSKLLQIYNLTDAEASDLSENETLHTAWKLKHTSGEYILKRHTFPPEPSQTDKLNHSCRLMDHLYAHNFPCPKPIQNKHGKWFTEYEGHNYQIFTVLPGQIAWSNATATHQSQAGVLLGNFHRLQSDLPNIPPPKDLRERISTGMERIVAEWDTFNMTRPDIRDAGAEALSRIEPLWQKLISLPNGFMHSDATPGNILFDGDQLIGLIDFEVIPGPFLLDFGMAAIRWASRFDDTTEIGRLDTNWLSMFLNAYTKARPFSPEEQNTLKDVLILAAIWSMSRQRTHRESDPAYRLTSRGEIYLAVKNLNLS
ncbi:MAG: phosphotransferase [Candidatus Latescibacteria bacterium]|jgi:homoserine kinase type II|nr:phosphotransferase [Candidatus Latescibacterota bacterium]MBT4138271.1 phosphotransferase [Candidatus Latescibacterota bacterium]MBT5832884.1 phosphotransferase [Candidatus Latescibacterota bacterium]